MSSRCEIYLANIVVTIRLKDGNRRSVSTYKSKDDVHLRGKKMYRFQTGVLFPKTYALFSHYCLHCQLFVYRNIKTCCWNASERTYGMVETSLVLYSLYSQIIQQKISQNYIASTGQIFIKYYINICSI